MSVLERGVNSLAMLRSELLKMPPRTDKHDLVWEIDGAEVHFEKFKSQLVRKSFDT